MGGIELCENEWYKPHKWFREKAKDFAKIKACKDRCHLFQTDCDQRRDACYFDFDPWPWDDGPTDDDAEGRPCHDPDHWRLD